MHFFNRILTVTTLAFLAFFLFLFLAKPDQEFSEAENRILQGKPCLSWDNLISGKFSFAAENYLADQFVFRDKWVGLKSAAELVLQKKDNNGVYFGRDGYLLQKPDKVDMALLTENIDAVNKFAKTVPVPVYFLLAPVSVQILDDKLPPFAEPQQKLEEYALIREQLTSNIQFIDITNALATHRQEYIYYRTDHHWTTKGAYYAYREAAPVLGFRALGLHDFSIVQACDDFYGTLYSKSGHRFIDPDTILLFKPKKVYSCRVEYVNDKKISSSPYAWEHLQQKDKYAVFLDGNHALIKITTPKQTGRKLLVVKDSYANSFIPFLLNHYDEIHVIDLRHFNFSLPAYIEKNRLNEVLLLYNTLFFAEDPSIRKIVF
ncbi:MAG: DHHW family protein [Dethiobacteria bacterium]